MMAVFMTVCFNTAKRRTAETKVVIALNDIFINNSLSTASAGDKYMDGAGMY